MAYLHHGWVSESAVFIVADVYTPSLLRRSPVCVGTSPRYRGEHSLGEWPIPTYEAPCLP